jgi:ribonuclease D
VTRRRRLVPASEGEPVRESKPDAEVIEGHEWIAEQARFEELVAELVSADRIAIDTEFHRERTYWPSLALIQIRHGDHIALVDPTKVDIAPLAAALTRPLIIMHAASQDLEVLDRSCGMIPERLFDTQVAAGFTGMSTPSLSNLVERYIGVRIPKGDRLTDWFERPLTSGQRRYAASDVAHLFELHDMLVSDLDSSGRLEWAQDECELARTPSRSAVPPELSYTRIKEARHLRGQAKAVASTLAEWRELTARRTDIPVRFVLSDLALVGIAQRAPTGADKLRGIRGVDGRFLRDGAAAAILEAVDRGRTLSPEEVPTLAQDETAGLEQALRPAVTLVSAWLAQTARDQSLDPALLATRSDISDLLRGAPDARLAQGWRRDLVGQPITDLVEGRSALAFDRGGGLVLEDRDSVEGESRT